METSRSIYEDTQRVCSYRPASACSVSWIGERNQRDSVLWSPEVRCKPTFGGEKISKVRLLPRQYRRHLIEALRGLAPRLNLDEGSRNLAAKVRKDEVSIAYSLSL